MPKKSIDKIFNAEIAAQKSELRNTVQKYEKNFSSFAKSKDYSSLSRTGRAVELAEVHSAYRKAVSDYSKRAAENIAQLKQDKRLVLSKCNNKTFSEAYSAITKKDNGGSSSGNDAKDHKKSRKSDIVYSVLDTIFG